MICSTIRIFTPVLVFYEKDRAAILQERPTRLIRQSGKEAFSAGSLGTRRQVCRPWRFSLGTVLSSGSDSCDRGPRRTERTTCRTGRPVCIARESKRSVTGPNNDLGPRPQASTVYFPCRLREKRVFHRYRKLRSKGRSAIFRRCSFQEVKGLGIQDLSERETSKCLLFHAENTLQSGCYPF